MEKFELLELLAKRLTKNEYDKAVNLLETIISDAVRDTRYDYDR